MSIFSISMKNLISFIKKSPLIFGVFFCCLALSTIILMYSVVLMQNYNSFFSSVGEDLTIIEVKNSAYLSSDDIAKRISDYANSNENAVCYTTVEAYDENRSEYKIKLFIGNEKKMFDKTLNNGSLESGVLLSESDFSSSNPVAVISGNYDKIETLWLGDKQLSVIGNVNSREQVCYAPFGAVFSSEDTINRFYVEVGSDADSVKKLKLYTDSLKKIFPELEVSNNLDTNKAEALQRLGFEAMAILLLVVISILNVSFLYTYLMRRRLKEIMIFKIHGCTIIKLIGIFACELIIITLLQVILSILIMFIIIIPIVAEYDMAFRYNFSGFSITVSVSITTLISFAILVPYMVKYCRMPCLEIRSHINN